MTEASFLRGSFVLLLLCVIAPTHAEEARKVYIIYMGSVDGRNGANSEDHINLLEKVVDKKQSLVRSYTRSFNGFAANLTAQEHEKIAGHESVVSTFPSQTYRLQTTRSWDFLGFGDNVPRNPTTESDIIIGVIDSGIWPKSQSFNDEGFGPPPKKWKGVCKGGSNFTCNNKLIGARYYGWDTHSAIDTVGHGCHTASIAAGNHVKDASFYGIAKGTARGAVPSARIAAYNVCPDGACLSEDIFSGMDDAIADGVNIITISIGGSPSELTKDPISIGSLHAVLKDILVVQAGGNSAESQSVDGNAPWIFTVTASTIDRRIVTRVALGNGTTLRGKGVNSFKLAGTTFPLAYGKNISTQCSDVYARQCVHDCLAKKLVKGKIVLCESTDGLPETFDAGALGTIVPTNKYNISRVAPLPASGLTKEQFAVVQEYFSSTSVPTVDILASESVTEPDAPQVAGFSSRGPNSIVPDILKTYITAPGVEILAAYSPLAPPSGNNADTRQVKYSILSGTSMSCPHVAGAAAYVKSIHPDWTASAIKSALMTTARKMNAKKDTDAEFAYGTGHIDPLRAADPGLVYETLPEDYVKMLCNLGYDPSFIKAAFQVICPRGAKMLPKDLNYPSMTFCVNSSAMNTTSSKFSANFTRKVTNVGSANSIYKATTSQGSNYNISVTPSTLTFKALHEKKSFEVIISGQIGNPETISASLEWSDGVHKVYSPVVVYQD